MFSSNELRLLNVVDPGRLRSKYRYISYLLSRIGVGWESEDANGGCIK